MSRVSPVKPPPESRWRQLPRRRIKALRDISKARLAFALKVSFQFCNESALFGPVRRPRERQPRSVQED